MINSSNTESRPSDRAAGRRFAAGPDGTVWDRTDGGLDERGRLAGLFVRTHDARDAVEALNDHDAARIRVEHCQRADRAEECLVTERDDHRRELAKVRAALSEAERELERARHQHAAALQDRDVDHQAEVATWRRDVAQLEKMNAALDAQAIAADRKLVAVREALDPTVPAWSALLRGDTAW